MAETNDQNYSNLLQFIISRDESIVIELLKDADACRTFIRLLTPLSQHFLFRMLMIPDLLPLSTIRGWAPPGTEAKLADAFNQLRDCHIIILNRLQNGEFGAQIHPEIRNVLLHGTSSSKFQSSTSQKPQFPFHVKPSNIFPEPSSNSLDDLTKAPEVSPETLDKWSSTQLDKILYWMLKLDEKIEPGMRQLLRDSNLIEIDNELTKEGHQFVLADRRSQIWLIVRSYLSSFLQDTSSDLISALRFLLKLGSLQFTRGYPVSSLLEPQRKLLEPFCSLGLVYQGNMKNYFFPTRIVLNFFGKEQLSQSEGWLLIDTNFKITAYTSSPLHVALLKKFTLITYEMPGFTSAYLSPNSFKKALKEGTSLSDIIRFLKSNLSSKGDGIIPPDVEHQLHVWKNQRDRIKTTPNCVMRTFLSRDDADAAHEIAEKNMGFVARFDSNDNYTIITTEEIEEEFAKQLKALRNS
ncbi:hypothetical protein TRFO_05247 [Tritrichomonas foetus]|uniref:General transcription factor IIH subunit 4 n=1 Tax=Tritrichomonas foetus TaxID=1144522 RepID=A0A1J4KD60_9EUKA|nr:hypothetical protein TRFO_05247 [Tritrichomonas foetus]|eukprot:OHT07590.1 hypothetical protein TRFO_05247 [Tritrichomonas foetus]